MRELDLLILGAGWTSTFLLPLCRARRVQVAATTRDGRDVASTTTQKWSFDPEGSYAQFKALPLAKTILVTFPLTGKGQSKLLKEGYDSVWGHKLGKEGVRIVQFGSTGIWQIEQSSYWTDRHSPYNHSSPRAVAEDELLALGGCVLNLAGLWGGERQPRNWVSRVAKSKDDVKGKKSLHLVHGMDVARGLLGIIGRGKVGANGQEEEGVWEKAGRGQRWMVTDGFVYDWWALMAGWADLEEGGKEGDVDREPADTARWVYELMREEDVKALPRSYETLGRCYDSRQFWETFEVTPLRARI